MGVAVIWTHLSLSFLLERTTTERLTPVRDQAAAAVPRSAAGCQRKALLEGSNRLRLAFRRLLNEGAQYRVDPCLITRTLLLEAIDNIAVEPERQ
jgi:hypothetical protein